MIINEYNVDLAALQEIRWPRSGQFKSNNMTIFYNGCDNGRHEYGVGFSLKRSSIKLVKNFEAVDKRLCYIIITGKTLNIAIMNCYVLTEVTYNNYKDDFHDNLESVYDMIS